MKPPNPLIALSRTLLLNVKLDRPTAYEEQQLKSISMKDFQHQLNTDDAKKTFWINIYNAYFQMLSNLDDIKMEIIFTEKLIQIAQNKFSLDDIEHGLLRKYRWKWSFGYFSNPFVSQLIKNLAVQELDYRIHFTLNCGAKSCPPIAFYTLEKLDEELNNAMQAFIVSETSVDMNSKTIFTSKLLYWYGGDFGGYSEIKKVLGKVLKQDFTDYKLSFKEYSWKTQLNNYITD